jgi:hypothetical protein
MSTVQGGQGNIVTNGLVLNLDAANPRSYPQPYNGTTWTDLSENGYNGTLVSGSFYTGSNGGAIVFDGVDDSITLGNISALGFTDGIFTADAWVYVSSTWTAGSQYPNLISKGASAGWDNDGWSLFIFRDYPSPGQYSLGCGIRQGLTSVIARSLNISTNTYLHIVATADGSNVKLYQNSVLVDTKSQTVNPGSNAKEVFIGKSWTDNYFNGNVALTRLYNRALSASEVLQNFNATRARFGI